MSREELPEYQIFYVLRNGEEQPMGPYSQAQLVELLNEGQIRSSDFTYYPELDGWKPISQVFDLHQSITNFGDEGQDPQIVADSFAFVDSRLEPDENIYYIAVQHFPALSLSAAVRLTLPKSLVMTNHRFCVLSPKMMGNIEFEEYPLEQVESVQNKVKTKAETGQLNIILRSGDWVELDKIPVDQLTRCKEVAADLLSGNFE